MVRKFQTGALIWNHSITQIRCWRESRFCRKLAEPAKNCWLAKSTWKQLNFSGTYTKVSVLFAVARKKQCKEEALSAFKVKHMYNNVNIQLCLFSSKFYNFDVFFIEKGCITSLNDDPTCIWRGLFYYPEEKFDGFKKKPTDYFFRAYQLNQNLMLK